MPFLLHSRWLLWSQSLGLDPTTTIGAVAALLVLIGGGVGWAVTVLLRYLKEQNELQRVHQKDLAESQQTHEDEVLAQIAAMNERHRDDLATAQKYYTDALSRQQQHCDARAAIVQQGFERAIDAIVAKVGEVGTAISSTQEQMATHFRANQEQVTALRDYLSRREEASYASAGGRGHGGRGGASRTDPS